MKYLTVFLIPCVLQCVFGRGINVGLCEDTYFDCKCGSDQGYTINIPIKQCTHFYRWKPQCKPCNDVKKEAACSKFSQCLECSNDGCKQCPQNRYGTLCTGVCECHNGGSCDPVNGQCHCAYGYTGHSCEIKTGSTCQQPKAPEHGNVTGNNYEEGQNVSYFCDAGFQLVGQSTQTCGSGGQWIGQPPHCEITCPVLLIPAESQISEASTYDGTEHKEGLHIAVKMMKFKCARGFYLVGPEILTCKLPGGKWDAEPPNCVKGCDIPKNPKHGHAIYPHQAFSEGAKVHYICHRGYVLRGEDENVCQHNGSWLYPEPTCEKVAFCSQPETPKFSQRLCEHGVGGEFSEGTRITYICNSGAIRFGEETIECDKSGTWSAQPPSCTYVSKQEISCSTKGADVLSEAPQIPIRIRCPEGCNKGAQQVWGTIIYRKDSKICAAAIHAGMIPVTGGNVMVINNGLHHSQFANSNSNGIKSKRHRSPAESFRFSFIDDERDSQCPNGWTAIGQQCFVHVNQVHSYKEASSICKNLVADILAMSDNTTTQSQRIRGLLKIKGATRMWVLNTSQGKQPPSTNPQTKTLRTSRQSAKNAAAINPESLKTSNLLNASIATCKLLDVTNGSIMNANCTGQLSFICTTNTTFINEDILCDDPGSILHGNLETEGKLDDLFVQGSTITFRCKPLYHLNGPETITCLSNSSWSHSKPKCIKMQACKEPPNITNGHFTVLPHASGALGRSAKMPRSRSISRDSETIGYDAETGRLPSDYHHVGTRIQFSCESRYYNLVGSSTRTCTKDGQWSGRESTCQPVCGISSDPRSPFIVNGQPTRVGQWPWQVGIARKMRVPEAQDYDHKIVWFMICGGTILSESWVVTAAHCVTVPETTNPIRTDEFKFYFGKYYRNDSMDDDNVQVRQVDDIQVYPDFNPVLFDGDIALVHLNEPLQLTSRVQPVCLPDRDSGGRRLEVGKKGMVTGWGMDENGTYSATLMQASVPIVSNSECEEGYRNVNVSLSVSGSTFCAGFLEAGKADSCSGDSGGPFVMSDGSGIQERWYLEGIVSWGSPLGCGEGRQYGGYTKVAAFTEWIQEFV